MKYLTFILLLISGIVFAQKQEVFCIDSLPKQGILLDKGWKWHAGDNREWAKPDFDDSAWESIDPTKDIMEIPEIWKTQIGWFRLRFTIDSLTSEQSLSLLVQQTGASEIFLNGKLIGKFGEINQNANNIKAATPVNDSFIGIPIKEAGEQVLSVRFALQKGITYIKFANQKNVAASLQLIETNNINLILQNDIRVYFDYLKLGLFLLLSIIHLALFYFNKSQKANFYFFLYAVCCIIYSILGGLTYYHVHYAATKMVLLIAFSLDGLVCSILLLTAIYEVFNHRRGLIYWGLIFYTFVSSVFLFLDYDFSFIYMSILPILVLFEVIRITLSVAARRHRGAFIIIWGFSISIIFYLVYFSILFKYLPAGPAWIYGHLSFNIMYLSMPIAISIYLALESSFNSRSLKEKLQEVETLSAEKQHILATQNETLEIQVTKRTSELNNSLEKLKATQNQLIQSEKLASLGELTAGIAHEIQNPLNFVNNFSELSVDLAKEINEEIEKPEIDKKYVEELLSDLTQNQQKINFHGKRASSIVKGMLEHSRSSTGERQPTDINNLVDEYLRLSYHGLRAKDKTFNSDFKAELEENLPKINVVPQEIGRVLLNLINNAFYAVFQKQKKIVGLSTYKPTVIVSTKKLENSIEITVKDNGIGIPENIKNKIFQPFFTTKPTGEGTGLGLSLAYDIVKKGHNGTIDVESVAGEGTTFLIKLPI